MTLRKVCLLITLAFFLSYPSPLVAQEQLEGYWEGVIAQQGKEVRCNLEFKRSGKELTATIDIPDLYILRYRLSNVSYDAPKIYFELPLGREPEKFDGALQGGNLSGQYTGRFYQEQPRSAAFHFGRQKPKALRYQLEEVSFYNGTAKLAGTLFLPLKKGPHSAVAGYAPEQVAEAVALLRLADDVIRDRESWEKFAAARATAQQKEWFAMLDRYPVKLPKEDDTWRAGSAEMDFDPRPLWESTRIPVLAIFGEADKSTPTQESARRIEAALRKANNKDFTIKIFPNADHALLLAAQKTAGGDWERPAPGWLDLSIKWLQQHTGR